MKIWAKKLKIIFYQQTITKRIILVITILSIISNIAFTGSVFLIMKNQLLSKTKTEHMKDMQMIEKQLNMFFQGIRNDAVSVLVSDDCQNLLLHTPERQEYDMTIRYRQYKLLQSLIMSTIGQRSEYNTIVLYDLDSNCYVDDRLQVSSENLQHKQKKIMQFMGEEENETILSMHKSAWRKKKDTEYKDCVSYLRKVYSKDGGKLIGIVEMEIPNEAIYEMYRPIMEQGSTIYLTYENLVVSAMDTSMLYRNLEQEKWYRSLNNKALVNGVQILKKGSDIYFQKSFSEFGWMIIDVVPASSYMRDVLFYAFIDIMLGIFLLAANLYISRILIVSITKPLSKITNTIVDIGQGDLEQRVSVKDGGEIGMLASEFNRMIEKTQDLMRQIVQTEAHKRESELALIQMQMTPHFFYNILENICGLIVMDHKKTAIQVIGLLSDFYRGVLNKGKEIIEIEQELAIAMNYLDIMKICHPDKFNYDIDCPLVVRKHHINKLTLQPILENAIHHGFENMSQGGIINITVGIDNGQLILEVSDNGKGISSNHLEELRPEPRVQMASFGLKNTDERIKLYFGTEYGIMIIEQDIGTKIRIVLPAKEG